MGVDVTLPSKYFLLNMKLMVVWANHLSDQTICGGLCYLNFQSLNIQQNDLMRRCVLCLINFAHEKHEFGFYKSQNILRIGPRVAELKPEPDLD